jgi:hypothetical protein
MKAGNTPKPFHYWLAEQILSTDFFKNTITLMLVAAYCALLFLGREIDSQFALLVGMVLGFYFKQ